MSVEFNSPTRFQFSVPGMRVKLFLPVVLILFLSTVSAPGQDEPPDDLVPPPLSVVSKGEKESLEAEKKMSDRTKLALEFMDLRLQKSESLAEKDEFEGSLDQLGHFRALMNNTLAFLLRNSDRKSSLKNLKRFEMKLKDFIPRLELVRRVMPYRFGYHVRHLIFSVRDTREKSIEPFYGDTVIPNGQ